MGYTTLYSSLTSEQIKSLEAIQWPACQIIANGGKNSDNCEALNLDSLSERRLQQCQTPCDQIACKHDHCLHYLLPAEHEPSVICRISSADKLPWIHTNLCVSKSIQFVYTNQYVNSFIILVPAHTCTHARTHTMLTDTFASSHFSLAEIIKLETKASSPAGQCILAGYCHAHMLLYESGVNYNVNGKYTKYLAQLCVRIFTFWNISTTH